MKLGQRALRNPELAWMADASCKGLPSGLFHPSDGDNHTAYEAKRICAACPVKQTCLDFAITNSERSGIWGGLNLPERRRYAKLRRLRETTDAS